MARPPRVRSGDYNRLVSIERVTEVPDGSGGQVEEWVEIAQAWCRANMTGASESLQAGTLQAAQNWRVEMRARGDIELTSRDRLAAVTGTGWLPPTHRIAISSVADPDGRGEKWVIFGTSSQAPDVTPPPGADL